MKDKANEFLSKLQTDDLEFIHDRVIDIMLEFGHYVAEEQKKQCLEEALVVGISTYDEKDIRIFDPNYRMREECTGDEEYVRIDINSILNSKNVCEQ
jgi:hypothetical protein